MAFVNCACGAEPDGERPASTGKGAEEVLRQDGDTLCKDVCAHVVGCDPDEDEGDCITECNEAVDVSLETGCAQELATLIECVSRLSCQDREPDAPFPCHAKDKSWEICVRDVDKDLRPTSR